MGILWDPILISTVGGILQIADLWGRVLPELTSNHPSSPLRGRLIGIDIAIAPLLPGFFHFLERPPPNTG